MNLSEEEHKKTHRDNLLRIADELEAIRKDASLCGETLRREVKKALTPKLYWPYSRTVQKVFDEVCDLYATHTPDITDEVIRSHLSGRAIFIRQFLN